MPQLYPSNQPSSSTHQSAYDQAPMKSSLHDMMQSLEPEDMQDMIPDPDDDVGDEENIFRDMSFDEILEDLNARFLVNLPKEEMNLVRVYWQAEQAHWFYEDYLRPLNPLLPQLSQRSFTHLIIASSPLYSDLSAEDYDAVWEEYCRYKRMVPCCGGILINSEGDKVLMVRGWKSSAGWCFPRGKINSEESEVACAIREVLEETGFDLAGRVNPKDRIQTQISAQTVTMFIAKDIDENTVFKTQTRKEIGAIEWVPFVDLPTWTGKKGPKTTTEKGKKKFYNVTPFVGPLKRWMSANGINPNPKRRPARSTQPSQTDANLRALQPYAFDDSPGPSPQPHHAQPKQFYNNTALDNLFHRFVHKQEQELDSPGIGGKDNKAGLQRLFQNIDVLKHEAQAGPTDQREKEKNEDDALARLLSGLGTATPAPRAAELKPAPTEKSNKLLAMLNTPASPAKDTAPVKPHQASLLAMLASPQQQIRSDTAASRSSAEISWKPVQSNHTSQAPSTTDEERARKQRALLEGMLGGFVSSPSSAAAYSPSSSVGVSKRDREVPANMQTSGHHVNAPNHSSSSNQHRPDYGHPSQAAPGFTSPGIQGGGNALPLYNQAASNYPQNGAPPQIPAQNLDQRHFPQHHPQYSHAPPPATQPEVTPEQQGLLNMLRNQPKPKQAGPVSGYRPAPYQSSGHQIPPPNVTAPGQFAPPPMMPISPGSQYRPPTLGLAQHPLPIRPVPQGPPGPGFTMQGMQGQKPLPDPSVTHHVMHQPPPAGAMFNQRGLGMPNGYMQGTIGGPMQPGSTFHHPVPRPPNAQAGTLLGMLNDGPR